MHMPLLTALAISLLATAPTTSSPLQSFAKDVELPKLELTAIECHLPKSESYYCDIDGKWCDLNCACGLTTGPGDFRCSGPNKSGKTDSVCDADLQTSWCRDYAWCKCKKLKPQDTSELESELESTAEKDRSDAESEASDLESEMSDMKDWTDGSENSDEVSDKKSEAESEASDLESEMSDRKHESWSDIESEKAEEESDAASEKEEEKSDAASDKD